MTEPQPQQLASDLSGLLEGGQAQELQRHLDELPSDEVPRAVLQLEPDEQTELLTILSASGAGSLLEELPDAHAAQLLEQLSSEQAAAILGELASNDQADLLARLDEADAESILQQMEPEAAANARRLVQYDSNTAGGMMITEFLSYPDSSVVDDVVSDLREHAEHYRRYDVQYAYVVDAESRLAGVLRLRDLLLSKRQTAVADIMIRQPLSVPLEMGLEELESYFDRHRLFGVPVVDAGGKLTGIVRRQDVEHAAEEQAGRTFLKFAGIVGGEELRTMPLRTRAVRRLSWLSINIVLNVIAASVIAFYQDTLEQVIALAVFLPIISDMSGCSGNQAVAVSMRELVSGLVTPRDVLRVLTKELQVGLVNGLCLGLLLAGVAWLWKGSPALGLVVGVALAVNTMVAVCTGGTIPLVLRGLGQDPALASGPMLTTLTDMFGFFAVLSLASLLLPYLVGI